MRNFWTACGHQHLTPNERGWLVPSPDYWRLWLQRPEMALVPESCREEERLHKALLRLSDRLTQDEDEDGKPKKRVFHDTMVDGAIDLCDLLKHMNVMNDPALEKARVQLEGVLSGVTPKDLRESEGTRVITKQKVDAILGAFDWGTDDDAAAASE